MTIRVLHGDCRDVLPTLAANSVHCVVTSPPYYGLRDYGVVGQLGLEATPDEYIQTMVGVFREVRRVLRDDGTCWVNMGDSYASSGPRGHGGRDGNNKNPDGTPRLSRQAGDQWGGATAICGYKPKDLLMMPARLALALQADGWWLRSDIIWAKPNPMPESVTDRPTSAHEHVFLLSKSARYFYDQDAIRWEPTGRTDRIKFRRWPEAHDNPNGYETDASVGRNERNVWTIATAPFSDFHYATFPPTLAERCIKAGTSERGCCAQCGAPWVRQTERTGASVLSPGSDYGNGAGRNDGGRSQLVGAMTTTTGWLPGCQCDAPTQPCTVLDPFAGAGTTCLVADRLQRDSIGIELNEAYALMARNRIVADAPLFAEVAD